MKMTYSDFEIISHEISFTKNSLEFYFVRQLAVCTTGLSAGDPYTVQTPGVANLSNLYRSNQAICH